MLLMQRRGAGVTQIFGNEARSTDGIVHRQNLDKGTSAYWFRQVGRPPIQSRLAYACGGDRRQIRQSLGPAELHSYREDARKSPGSPQEQKALEVQRAEWQLLFDWCAK